MADQLSSADRAYDQLRAMAIHFEFKPGERVNESALTKQLSVSRTPLREALNRLVAEGFLTVAPGQGFFCRPLSPERILELYQVRAALESEALMRGIATASEEAIVAFCAHLDATERAYSTSTDLPDLLEMDETFHVSLAALSGNAELVRLLKNVNERIRYVRLVNLQRLLEQGRLGQGEQASLSMHRVIAEAVRARDTHAALGALRDHIERRSEETVELVRLAYSRLYVPD
ncbi:MAG: GntR family transcriptional regulator [Paracoccaceae bacterium]